MPIQPFGQQARRFDRFHPFHGLVNNRSKALFNYLGLPYEAWSPATVRRPHWGGINFPSQLL
jgi:hypothetical protein